jgi:hypothetical protein
MEPDWGKPANQVNRRQAWNVELPFHPGVPLAKRPDSMLRFDCL